MSGTPNERAMCITTAFALSSLLACSGSSNPFEENVDISVCDPAGGPFSLTIDNPYFPLVVGTQWTYQGNDGGTAVQLVITILDETQVAAGVTTRVLEERETHDGNLVEVSRNFFVQEPGGAVCYFGEDVDIYENGVIVSHDGAWRAGVDNAVPGIFITATPEVGQKFRQEVAPGVAMDRVEIVATGETVTVPYGTFSNTVRFRETTPLESGSSTKIFAQGVGLIVDDVLRLVSRTP